MGEFTNTLYEIINISWNKKYRLVSHYTEYAGLPFFDRAAVTENGYWYYTSALRPMRGNQSFHYHLENIGPICT